MDCEPLDDFKSKSWDDFVEYNTYVVYKYVECAKRHKALVEVVE